MSRVFFDANILLAILLKRTGCNEVIEIQNEHKASQIYISALTSHLVVHFRPKELGLKVVEAFLDDYIMADLSSDDFRWAFDNIRDEDFEDALQIAVAIRTGCDTFVTFDKQLAKTYSNLPTLKIKLLT